eukprot:Platyproteum_vivax@DN4569_c0_g1_i1.p1
MERNLNDESLCGVSIHGVSEVKDCSVGSRVCDKDSLMTICESVTYHSKQCEEAESSRNMVESRWSSSSTSSLIKIGHNPKVRSVDIPAPKEDKPLHGILKWPRSSEDMDADFRPLPSPLKRKSLTYPLSKIALDSFVIVNYISDNDFTSESDSEEEDGHNCTVQESCEKLPKSPRLQKTAEFAEKEWASEMSLVTEGTQTELEAEPLHEGTPTQVKMFIAPSGKILDDLVTPMSKARDTGGMLEEAQAEKATLLSHVKSPPKSVRFSSECVDKAGTSPLVRNNHSNLAFNISKLNLKGSPRGSNLSMHGRTSSEDWVRQHKTRTTDPILDIHSLLDYGCMSSSSLIMDSEALEAEAAVAVTASVSETKTPTESFFKKRLSPKLMKAASKTLSLTSPKTTPKVISKPTSKASPKETSKSGMRSFKKSEALESFFRSRSKTDNTSIVSNDGARRKIRSTTERLQSTAVDSKVVHGFRQKVSDFVKKGPKSE